MEEKTARANHQISAESDQEDLVMLIAATADDPLDAQPHEEQVGQGIDNLGGVDGGIVILARWSASPAHVVSLETSESREVNNTSSHQLRVEVTGLQNPALVGGYGMKGRDHRIVMWWSEEEKKRRRRRRSERAAEA